jgi:hypothetical protein
MCSSCLRCVMLLVSVKMASYTAEQRMCILNGTFRREGILQGQRHYLPYVSFSIAQSKVFVNTSVCMFQ